MGKKKKIPINNISSSQDDYENVREFAETILQQCEDKGLTVGEVDYLKSYLPMLIRKNVIKNNQQNLYKKL